MIQEMIYTSPLGRLWLREQQGKLIGISFDPPEKVENSNSPLLLETCRQLEQYFQGERREFSLPIELRGTDFQCRCWEALRQIPWGYRVSYGQVARWLNLNRGYQAVGQAVNKNPLFLIIPCHRVIGHDGKLVGYGNAGLWRKQFLLDLEDLNKG